MRFRLAILTLGVSACSGTPSQSPGDAAASCEDPVACADWIQAYERDVVARLTGHEPIAGTLRLRARFEVEERNAAREFIALELEGSGLRAERQAYRTGENVFARLEAAAEDAPVILMGCHFDGVRDSPAAGDDGTGVALVLSAARYFAEQEVRDNHMIFAFFDEEEVGLLGSQAFAETMRQEQPALAAAHLYDLLSWDADRDGAVELWSPTPELEARYRRHAETKGIPVQAVDFASSDHASFIGSGFPAVGVSEEFVSGDANPSYHTPEDTYDNIDFDYLERMTRLALRVTSELH